MAHFEQFLSSRNEHSSTPFPFGTSPYEDAHSTSEAVSDNRWAVGAAVMALGILAVSRGRGAKLLKETIAKAEGNPVAVKASREHLTFMEASTPGGRSAGLASESKALSTGQRGAPAIEVTSGAGARSGGAADKVAQTDFAAGKVSAPAAEQSVVGARSSVSAESGSAAVHLDLQAARSVLTDAAKVIDNEVVQAQLAAGVPKRVDLAQIARVSEAVKGGDNRAIGSALDDIFKPRTYEGMHRLFGG